MQKLLSLIRSHLFIFASLSFALGDQARKIVTIYVRGCFACVLCWEFCGVVSDSCGLLVGPSDQERGINPFEHLFVSSDSSPLFYQRGNSDWRNKVP